MTDINVNISRATGSVSRAGFGTALILSSTTHPFSVYTDLGGLSADFGADTTVYKMASALMGQKLQPKTFAVAGIAYDTAVDSVTDLTDFLNTLVLDGKDFYLVLQEQDDELSQEEVSAWASANEKLHFIRTNVLPSASVVTAWDARTAILYTSQADEYPASALAGFGLPKDTGSLTWKNVELSGITPESLSGTEMTELKDARYNTVINYYGRTVASDGFLQGSLFIDQQRAQDFVKNRMEENLAQLLINNDKIPYDDSGIAQVVSVVSKSLNNAFRNGIIAKDKGGQALYTVKSIPRADIPQNDIDERVLKTIDFEYVEAGAIEGATVSGKIVAEL